MATYKIVRMFFDDGIDNIIIKRGLSEDEAKEYCQDPETSSSTCEEKINKDRTALCGAWFCGFTEEFDNEKEKETR